MVAVLLSILLVANFAKAERADAVSFSENFGASCYSLNSGLSVLYNGNQLQNSITVNTAHWQAYTNALMSGCALRLWAITSNLVVAFPQVSLPVSLSFATYAVNGNQTAIVTYFDSTTTTFVIPDTTSLSGSVNTVSFAGSGKRIASLTFTPANNPDTYVIDNLTWSAPSGINLGTPTLSAAAFKGQLVTASVTSDGPGKATFYVNSKRIPKCIAVNSTGSSPNYSTSCTFKPAVIGSHTLQVLFTPTDIGALNGRSEAVFTVSKRSNRR